MATAPRPENEFLTSQQIADEIGVRVETARKWIREGRIKGFRFSERTVRVPREEMERFRQDAARESTTVPVNGSKRIGGGRMVSRAPPDA